MATREEWMAQLKKADAAAQAGNEDAQRDFMKIKQIILDGDKNGTWKTGGGGAPKAPVGPPEGTDEQGILQQLFDVRNAQTGESYLYGNKPAPTGFDDITRIMSDTATRGFGDKITGTANLTDAARERTPGYVEAPADIVAAIASSPYRVASMGAGAVAGGLEGAASAYGNQEGWVPDVGNMAYEGGKGALLGAGGAKAGEWLGKGWNAINPFQKKAPYQTPEDLYTAAEKAGKRKSPGPKNRDILAREQRMKAAELANEGGQGAFRKLREGMDQPMTDVERVFGPDKSRIDWPHQEKKLIERIASNKATEKATNLQDVGNLIQGGNWPGKFIMAKATGGAAPLIGGMVSLAGKMTPGASNKKTYDELRRTILDSTGRMKTDKATVDKARDLMAKIVMQGGEQQ